jgi:hypothetical protein
MQHKLILPPPKAQTTLHCADSSVQSVPNRDTPMSLTILSAFSSDRMRVLLKLIGYNEIVEPVNAVPHTRIGYYGGQLSL